ncbi:MAG: DNA methyltransferase [Methermicoccaceae archaeon]
MSYTNNEQLQHSLLHFDSSGGEEVNKSEDKTAGKFTRRLEREVDPIKWITENEFEADGLKLFDDVGQLYEIQLAKMEFKSLGDDLESFRKRAAYFELVDGKKTNHYYLSNVRGKGQIGHTNQYLTHWFYPYKGKFHGQMIKAIINFVKAEDRDTILDPFMGSGTTLIEAATVGTKGVGIEINPALCIVSQIKLDSMGIDYPEFEAAMNEEAMLHQIFDYFNSAESHLRERVWRIESSVQDATSILNELWDSHFPSSFVGEYPFEWRNVLMLIYLHALSDYTYLKGTNKEKPLRDFFFINFREYSKTIKGCYNVFNKLKIAPKQHRVLLGSALDIPLNDGSVKGIITSPPYSIALNYVKNDLHLLNYLGIDTSLLQEEMVGLKGKKKEKLRLYERDMKKSIEEMHRVLKKGGWIAIVLGDVVVNGKRTDFCEKIMEWAPEIGFTDAFAMKRPILGGFARLRYEHILFLQK